MADKEDKNKVKKSTTKAESSESVEKTPVPKKSDKPTQSETEKKKVVSPSQKPSVAKSGKKTHLKVAFFLVP